MLIVEPVSAQSADDHLSKAQEHHINALIDSAVYFYKKAVLSLKENDQKIESLNLAVDIADVFYANNDYDNGLQVLNVVADQPLNFANEEERAALLETHLFKAYGLEQLGKFAQAKEVYLTAKLELVNKIEYEDYYVARYLYQPLGNIYTRLGELEEALRLLDRFKSISIKEKEYNAAAQAYNDIGIIYKSLNQYDKVIADYREALELPQLTSKTKGLLLSNLATAYYETQQNKEALNSAEFSLAMFEKALQKSQNPDEIFSYQSLVYSTVGKIYASLEKYYAAMKNFEQSIDLARKAYGTEKRREIAKIYVSIGYLHLQQEKVAEALENYQQALSCILPNFNPKDTYQNPKAKTLYPENTIFEALEGKARALEALYQSNRKIKLLQTSLECFDLIINVEAQLRQNYLNESSKLLLLDESHHRSERALNVAHQLYQLTGKPQYIDKAFQIAERSKAIILLESLKTLKVNDFANIPDSLLLKEQELKSNISLLKKGVISEQLKGVDMDSAKVQALSNELFQDETTLQQLNATFRNEYPQYFNLKNATYENLDIDCLRKEIISPASQLIEYFVGEYHLFIFSLTQDEFTITKLIKDTLDKTVQSLIQQVSGANLQASNPDVFAKHAYGLYKTLLDPVIKNDKSKLIIVPDGILGYLPFDVLIGQQDENPEFRSLHYLMKSKTISYGFSSNILLENSIPDKTTNYKDTFLGVAPIFEKSSAFPLLPYSKQEVKSIQEFFGGRTLLGREATKTKFKNIAGQYQILHLSSHAAVVDSLPLYSWISFNEASGNTEDDYKLYLSELYSMQLNAELVVLSACETGRGKLSRGEGIMSLARGFAYTGCNSIVTTLWPVNDASTSFIMRRFYHHLDDGQPKDEALRMAKLDYLNGDNIDEFGANPFFWAAYIPIGSMDSLKSKNQFKTYIWYSILALGILAMVVVYRIFFFPF